MAHYPHPLYTTIEKGDERVTVPAAAATAAAGAAGAAAAARRRLEQQEEEELTQYTQEDLENEWEFKIVRATGSVFKKPEKLRQVIEEEARSGWMMVEKFDNQRVRFKRRVKMRDKDADLPRDVDPYRTYVGTGDSVKIAIIVAVALLVGLFVALAIVLRAVH